MSVVPFELPRGFVDWSREEQLAYIAQLHSHVHPPDVEEAEELSAQHRALVEQRLAAMDERPAQGRPWREVVGELRRQAAERRGD